jgi:hypothetical protein
MDKTPSYAWENPRKVMENEISSSVFTRTSTVSRKVMDNEISESSSPDLTRTSKFSRKVMDNEISLKEVKTIRIFHCPLLFLRTLMYV